VTNSYRAAGCIHNISDDCQAQARPDGHFLIGHEGALGRRSRDEWVEKGDFNLLSNAIAIIGKLNLRSSSRPFA
jgi:hypothetical protein